MDSKKDYERSVKSNKIPENSQTLEHEKQEEVVPYRECRCKTPKVEQKCEEDYFDPDYGAECSCDEGGGGNKYSLFDHLDEQVKRGCKCELHPLKDGKKFVGICICPKEE